MKSYLKKSELYSKEMISIKGRGVLILECVILYAGLVLCGVTTGLALLVYEKFDTIENKHETNSSDILQRVGI